MTQPQYETPSVCVLCESSELWQVDIRGRLVECKACGGIFDSPRPKSEAIIAFYSKHNQYQPWIEELAARTQLWKRRLEKMRRHIKTGSVLDVGAGIGHFLHLAKASFQEREGTEVSEAAVAEAKKLFQLDLRLGLVDNLDFKGAVFDNITLFHVLEHVPYPKQFLSRIRDLMPNDGRLFVAVPNDLASLGARIRWILSAFGWRKKSRGRLGLPFLSMDGTLDEIHLIHFTPKTLRQFLEKMGFRLLESSLDPFYAAKGWQLLKHEIRYRVCRVIYRFTKINIYGTIWMVVEKTASA
jgi:SAM-dependent methyltransferase